MAQVEIPSEEVIGALGNQLAEAVTNNAKLQVALNNALRRLDASEAEVERLVAIAQSEKE